MSSLASELINSFLERVNRHSKVSLCRGAKCWRKDIPPRDDSGRFRPRVDSDCPLVMGPHSLHMRSDINTRAASQSLQDSREPAPQLCPPTCNRLSFPRNSLELPALSFSYGKPERPRWLSATEKPPWPPRAAGRWVLEEGRNILTVVAEMETGVKLKDKSRKKWPKASN